jgi:hypothetical protein
MKANAAYACTLASQLVPAFEGETVNDGGSASPGHAPEGFGSDAACDGASIAPPGSRVMASVR